MRFPGFLAQVNTGFSPFSLFQTKAGPVLVAVNPFKKVLLYGNDYIEAYKRKSLDNPHVYAITDTAMREMIRGKLILKC